MPLEVLVEFRLHLANRVVDVGVAPGAESRERVVGEQPLEHVVDALRGTLSILESSPGVLRDVDRSIRHGAR